MAGTLSGRQRGFNRNSLEYGGRAAPHRPSYDLAFCARLDLVGYGWMRLIFHLFWRLVFRAFGWERRSPDRPVADPQQRAGLETGAPCRLVAPALPARTSQR